MTAVTRDDVLRFRTLRHQLDVASGSDDVALLDYGVQDTGTDGATWALAIRGHAPAGPKALVYAWTVRGAPHAYRRADIADVAAATAPFSEADAAKRIFDAAKPLRQAGIAVLDALALVADHLRRIAEKPVVKGDASGALADVLDNPFLRYCRVCKATHIFEMPFRLAALQAGLELEAGTSPPVLRRIPKLQPLRFTRSGGTADNRFHVVRNYLRFFGPATVGDAASFIDAPIKEVQAQWPTDVEDVRVDGERRWVLADDLDLVRTASFAPGLVHLLGPYDPYLQLRDRALLVRDDAKRKVLWPVLGRPGVVFLDGEVAGTWRGKLTKRRLAVAVEPWQKLGTQQVRSVGEQAERLAAHRGVALGDVTFAP